MIPKPKKGLFLLGAALYLIGLGLFYFKYVPLVASFQAALLPILLVTAGLTIFRLQWGTLFFVLAFPLINNLPYFFGFSEIPHAPTALLLFLFYFLGWILRRPGPPSEPRNEQPIFRPLLLFSLIIGVSAVLTFLRYANFFPFQSDDIYELVTNAAGVTAGGAIFSTVLFSLNYLSGAAFFFIFLKAATSRAFLRKTVMALSLGTALSLAFGLVQHVHDLKLGNCLTNISQGLINSTFKDSLSFGAYLSIVIPVIVGLAFVFKRLLRVAAVLVALVSGYLIWFAGSKIGFFSFFLALVVFLVLAARKYLTSSRIKTPVLKNRPLSTAVVIALVVPAVVGLVLFRKPILREITHSGTYVRLVFDSGTLKRRAESFWKIALLMIRDYPLTGVGLGGYIIESANYSRSHNIPLVPESSENYVLQVGSELGVVGILLVLWILWEIIKQIIGNHRKIPDDDRFKYLWIGAVIGVLSFLINIQFHTYIGSYEIKYTFWLLVGLIFALSRTSPGEEREKEGQARGETGPAALPGPGPFFSRRFKISSAILVILFGGVHLWNSTHSLSLESRTRLFGLKQEFGLDRIETDPDGREFRWTRSYGGLALKIEKPFLILPLQASHPDIQEKPVQVQIFITRDFFRHTRLIKTVALDRGGWNDVLLSVSGEIGRDIILLLKVSRTWNPLKVKGVPDPRNLGVALGKLSFRDS